MIFLWQSRFCRVQYYDYYYCFCFLRYSIFLQVHAYGFYLRCWFFLLLQKSYIYLNPLKHFNIKSKNYCNSRNRLNEALIGKKKSWLNFLNMISIRCLREIQFIIFIQSVSFWSSFFFRQSFTHFDLELMHSQDSSHMTPISKNPKMYLRTKNLGKFR